MLGSNREGEGVWLSRSVFEGLGFIEVDSAYRLVV